ncbi:MAG: ribonuclease catalytic domain-containing protein, partial [Desulfobacterales bacterium]
NGISLDLGRERILEALRQKVEKRNRLKEKVRVRELWEVLNSERQWIDLETMTAFCFPGETTDDHESAVLRAFFDDRSYFKFQPDGFFPFGEEQVERMRAQAREEARKTRLIETGGAWLRNALSGKAPVPPDDELPALFKSLYLYEKDSPHYAIGRAILSRAQVQEPADLFSLLVRLGIFQPDENVDLIRMETPVAFAAPVAARAERLASRPEEMSDRTDLTDLSVMTIDGQATLDFDDALSIEKVGRDRVRLGIHIADVAHVVGRDDPVDQEALRRGSSVYMPDMKIPMLPPLLAEERCSLKAGQFRPAVSILAELTPAAEVVDFTILATRIRVDSQLTYQDVNASAEENPDIRMLQRLAEAFRQRRFAAGALQIDLPEIHVWVDRDGIVRVNQVNRESPARMLVTELMILANWLMARFLTENGQPAVFRSQAAPRQRLYENGEGTLFQNWMQRKQLSRFVLGTEGERHAGLGLDAYVTATSPIRKAYDLITQRQIRALLGLETPYSAEEIAGLLQVLEEPMNRVGRLQMRRHRYWLLRHLEGRIGEKTEAIVLYRKRSSYLILLTDYLMECDLPADRGPELKPEDLIQVTFQRVNARKDAINVYLG